MGIAKDHTAAQLSRHPEAQPKDLMVGIPGKTVPTGLRKERFLPGKTPGTQAVASLRMTTGKEPGAGKDNVILRRSRRILW
jgi:hypothetical protein